MTIDDNQQQEPAAPEQADKAAPKEAGTSQELAAPETNVKRPQVQEPTASEPVTGLESIDETPGGQQVEDPVAYWQSQQQKYERLLRKAKEQAAKYMVDDSPEEPSKQEAGAAAKAELEALRAELQAARTEAETKAVEAMRVKAMAGAGLDPELAEFVTASDADGIQAQVAKLAERLGAQRAPGGTGGTRTGNPAGGSSLTIETIRQMTPEQINARKEEVDRVLAEQGRK